MCSIGFGRPMAQRRECMVVWVWDSRSLMHLRRCMVASWKLESEGTGHGARFILHLRVEKEHQAPVEVRRAPVHSLIRAEGLDRRRFSRHTRAILNNLRSAREPRLLAPSSAAEALSYCSHNTPDIIVSDIGMPELTDYELLKKLANSPGFENVPAIAISGYASEEDRKRALGVGYLRSDG